jgi:predicted transcriptional regulator
MTIIQKQLQKVVKHYQALKEYKEFIKQVGFQFTIDEFNSLNTPQKAVLEAYLKRFASLQDYLGAKVFKSLLDMAGIGSNKMSEILTTIEKEEIVSLDKWIEFRNLRNNLEHYYPDELEDALKDLKKCIDSFDYMEEVVIKVFKFARRYNENIRLP